MVFRVWTMSRICLSPIYSWLGAGWPLPKPLSEAASVTSTEWTERHGTAARACCADVTISEAPVRPGREECALRLKSDIRFVGRHCRHAKAPGLNLATDSHSLIRTPAQQSPLSRVRCTGNTGGLVGGS